MQRLWAPWRLAYLDDARSANPPCPFCPPQKHILYEATWGVVMLNRFPSGYGHLLIASRHHFSPYRLHRQSRHELAHLVDAAVEILDRYLKPDGFNVGMNIGLDAGASIPDHAHWHVLPRWRGDHNYLPVLADVKTLPELLDQTTAKMVPWFADVKEML